MKYTHISRNILIVLTKSQITIDLFCKQEIALRDNKRVSNRAQAIEELRSGNGGILPRDASNRESELFDPWHIRIFI